MNKHDLIKSALNNKTFLVLFASPMRWDPLIIFYPNCDCLANFTLPAESKEGEESPFKEITFTELEREEAAKLVEKYNKVSNQRRSKCEENARTRLTMSRCTTHVTCGSIYWPEPWTGGHITVFYSYFVVINCRKLSRCNLYCKKLSGCHVSAVPVIAITPVHFCRR